MTSSIHAPSHGSPLGVVREALERNGCRTRDGGRNWTCPSHEDENPSLSVNDGRDGVVLFCHANCSFEQVTTALGLLPRDLFYESLSGGRTRVARRPKPKLQLPKKVAPVKREESEPSRVVEVYVYDDEKGAPRFEVRRLEPKSFRQARIEPDGTRVCSSGCMDVVKLVPFRLPELLLAIDAGDPIWVAEGEKDVNRMHAELEVATCNPGGAGKWRDEFSQYFAGAKDVKISQHTDKSGAGQAHAIQVRDSLQRVGITATTWKALDVNDISDHFDAGHGIDDLVEVVDPEAELALIRGNGVDSKPPEPEAEPEPEPDAEPSISNVRFADSSIAGWFQDEGNLLADVPPRSFLINDFLSERIPALLVARGGTGKGFFELTLSISLALGERLGQLEVPKPRGVLLVSKEDDRLELQRRFGATLRARYPGEGYRDRIAQLVRNLHVVDLFGDREARLGQDLVDDIQRAMEKMTDPGLVWLDPLTKLLPESEHPLNTQEGAGAVHNWLDLIVQKTDCTVGLAHHINKAAAQSGKPGAGATTGSQQLEDLARFVIQLTDLPDDDLRDFGFELDEGGYGFVLGTVTKSNYGPPLRDPLVFERGEGGVYLPRQAQSRFDTEDLRVLRVLSRTEGRSLTRNDWVAACAKSEEEDEHLTRDRARKAITRCKRRGLAAQVDSTEGRSQPYMLTPQGRTLLGMGLYDA